MFLGYFYYFFYYKQYFLNNSSSSGLIHRKKICVYNFSEKDSYLSLLLILDLFTNW